MTSGEHRDRTTASPGWSTARDVLPLVLVFVLAVAVLAGLAVLPAKTWFSQRSRVAAAEADLARLEAETAALETQLADLSTDAEIELRAREDFGLVYPGEESYRIVTE